MMNIHSIFAFVAGTKGKNLIEKLFKKISFFYAFDNICNCWSFILDNNFQMSSKIEFI